MYTEKVLVLTCSDSECNNSNKANSGNDIILIYNCIMITYNQLNKNFRIMGVGASDFFFNFQQYINIR